jgi:hypothetical protein
MIMRFSSMMVGIFLGLTMLSCSNKMATVSPVRSAPPVRDYSFIYTLPRTVILIKVDACRSVFYPGPYAAYARKYLGISDVPTLKSEQWTITDITIKGISESDPSMLFAVFTDGHVPDALVQMTEAGLVIPENRAVIVSMMSNDLRRIEYQAIPFSDLSVEPFIGEEKNILYTKVQRDSSFVRVPIQKSMIVEKNADEKAGEAADLIFNLRKRRLEFLTTDVDQPLEGNAVHVILDEIYRLENEYLSLFLGKTAVDTISKTYLFTPSGENNEKAIAFRFSPTKGLLAQNDLSGSPMLVEVEPEPVPDSSEPLLATIGRLAEKQKLAQIFYRIPVVSTVKISDGKSEIASRRIPIYQLGPLVKIPAEFY